MSKVGSTLELERGFKSVVEWVEIGERRGAVQGIGVHLLTSSMVPSVIIERIHQRRLGSLFQPDRPGLIHGALPDFWLPGKIRRCSHRAPGRAPSHFAPF